MRLSKYASVVCVAACAVIAQDLAPEVLLLSRIKSHLRYEFAHLPNYTCLETIARFQKAKQRGLKPRRTHSANAADQSKDESWQGGKFSQVDTVRLEVACSGHHEWYGLPGAQKLSEENPAALAGGVGLISNGSFSTTLHNLFMVDGATFTSRGEDSVDGRKAVKFDYRFPTGSIIARISLFGGQGAVNEEGSFWVDPQSLDLLRLDGRATEIPPSLPLAEMEFTVTYARTRIGEFDALLAQFADLHMLQTTGVEDYDRMDFTHCRMFQTTSTLRFDIEPPSPPNASVEARVEAPVEARVEAPRGTAAPAGSEDALPASLRVTVQVTTPITDRDAPGKLIEGRVAGDVRRKGRVVLEDGAPVHGRIRSLQRYQGSDHFIVGLEFTEVQAQGAPLRFYADLVSVEKWEGVQAALRKEVLLPNHWGSTVDITLPELPGVALFFVEGETFVLQPGLRTVWRTRELREAR
jgi:hypothetical protein